MNVRADRRRKFTAGDAYNAASLLGTLLCHQIKITSRASGLLCVLCFCVFIWRRYQSTPFKNIHSGAQCARGIGGFISNADRKIFSTRRLMCAALGRRMQKSFATTDVINLKGCRWKSVYIMCLCYCVCSCRLSS